MEKELQVHHVFETAEHSSGLLYRWLTHLLRDQRRFVAVSMPKGVALTHFEQGDADGNRQAFMHLYNGTGSHLSPGQRIPQRPPPATSATTPASGVTTGRTATTPRALHGSTATEPFAATACKRAISPVGWT